MCWFQENNQLQEPAECLFLFRYRLVVPLLDSKYLKAQRKAEILF